LNFGEYYEYKPEKAGDEEEAKSDDDDDDDDDDSFQASFFFPIFCWNQTSKFYTFKP
jgi:hypothetical protein